jgi:hypothetical protein
MAIEEKDMTDRSGVRIPRVETEKHMAPNARKHLSNIMYVRMLIRTLPSFLTHMDRDMGSMYLRNSSQCDGQFTEMEYSRH